MANEPNVTAATTAGGEGDPKPWAAVLLSLLSTGLGQIYCGRMRRGLVFFLLSLLFAPAASLAMEMPPSRMALLALCASLVVSATLFLASVVDAGLLARRMRGTARPERGPGAIVYALFVLVGVAYPLGAVLLLRARSVEAFKIAGASMEPTLLKGDRVLVDKGAWRTGGPERGDVVVFRGQDERGRARNFVRRVIGLPGDRVEIRKGEVRVNGRALPRSPTAEEGVWSEENGSVRYRVRPASPVEAGDVAEIEVPTGHCFLLGDRRDASSESLRFRSVPVKDVVGPVRYLFWSAGSWDRFGAFR